MVKLQRWRGCFLVVRERKKKRKREIIMIKREWEWYRERETWLCHFGSNHTIFSVPLLNKQCTKYRHAPVRENAWKKCRLLDCNDQSTLATWSAWNGTCCILWNANGWMLIREGELCACLCKKGEDSNCQCSLVQHWLTWVLMMHLHYSISLRRRVSKHEMSCFMGFLYMDIK